MSLWMLWDLMSHLPPPLAAPLPVDVVEEWAGEAEG